jgi:hypothetical protein
MIFLAFIVISKGYSKRFPDYVARASVQGLEKTPRGECFRREANIPPASGQFCVYGVSDQVSEATAMFWGDSHANMYLTPLTNASKVLGRTGLIATMAGCRPWIEDDSRQHSTYSNCKDFNREVVAYLFGHPKIETVILGQSWGDPDEAIGRNISMIRQLIAHGRKVILIGPLPRPGMDVQIAWSMRQIQAGHAIDEIKLDRSSQGWLSSTTSELVKQLGRDIEYGNLVLIEPTQRFCDAKFCYVVRDGLATFADTGHLTEAAAQEMEPDFRKALLLIEPQK